MKLHYNVTINSDIKEKLLEEIVKQLLVELEMYAKETGEMFNGNISLNWEKA